MCGYSSTDDEKYMRHAIELAKKGWGGLILTQWLVQL